MNRGFIKLYRKALDAGWLQNPKLWALWCYCLLKASHKPYQVIVKGVKVDLEPGEFVFTLRNAAQDLKQSIKEIRTGIEFLKKCENMAHKPTHRFSIISIINWDIYQATEGRQGHTEGQAEGTLRGTSTRTVKNVKKTPADFLKEISILKEKYSDQEIVNQAFQAISSTRKSNKISDTVRLSILQAWDQYPVESVMTGIKTFLDKGYHLQGKRESYLLGIIRNVKPEDSISGQAMRSTGSPLLDDHYRNQGIRII